ncbi:MAG: hypothetical protein KY454_09790 [Actinobacteria bacterium]|nr:hypothetical protein [Actinomycetota bacterium]MBW3649824.1 hypothetical protein [Actinomycetota bacterium]
MPHPHRRCPRRLVGALACLAAAVGSACARPAGEPPAAERLKRAVLRTVDEGSARVMARIRSEAGVVVVVEGVSSLVGPEAWAKATVEGLPAASSEVRMTAGETWVRPPGSTEWIAVDPAVADGSPVASWGGLLRGLAGATGVTGTGSRLAATVDGARVTVLLDGQGRVSRVQRQRDGLDVSLELSDFGVKVDVEPP